MDDLRDSFALSAATAVPLSPCPLPDFQSWRNEKSSSVNDELKAFPDKMSSSHEIYMKKIFKVKKGQAMKRVAKGVPHATSSFYSMEQGKPVNVVTTPAISKQAAASPVSSTMASPAGLGHSFSPLPPLTCVHFPVAACCEELLLFSWSEEATFTLIEAWGRRSSELKRGHFRQEDWQLVADAVNAIHAKSEKAKRSRFQCRFRMDFIKKRYKLEKLRVTSLNLTHISSWPFFERMDALMTQADLQNLMQGLSIAPAQQVPTASPVASTPAAQSGE